MIENNKKEFIKNSYIELPDIIFEPKDLYVDNNTERKIQTIYTGKECYGDLTSLKLDKRVNISNKVVCIENADQDLILFLVIKLKV